MLPIEENSEVWNQAAKVIANKEKYVLSQQYDYRFA
jgi:hypothetical protein